MGTATIAAPDSCLESYRSSPSPFIIAHARLAHTALRCPLNRISRFCFFARRPPVSHTHARMTQLPLAIQMPKYTHKSRKTSHVADITHSSLYLSTGILSLSLVPPHVLSLALSEIRLPKRDGVSLQAAFFSLRRSSFDPVSIQFRTTQLSPPMRGIHRRRLHVLLLGLSLSLLSLSSVVCVSCWILSNSRRSFLAGF